MPDRRNRTRWPGRTGLEGGFNAGIAPWHATGTIPVGPVGHWPMRKPNRCVESTHPRSLLPVFGRTVHS